MTVPLPAPRWLGLAPCGRNKDKTENHPLARKGGQLRTPDTGIYEFFPKLILVEVFASCVLNERNPFSVQFKKAGQAVH